MANVLLTGFEPFDQDALNPSWEAVRALQGWRCAGATVQARRISCVFGVALQELDAAIGELQPQLVIGVGQAGGRAEITPERVAINVDDGRICDNAGCQPIDMPVVAGAPAAYFSTLPIKAMVRDLRAAGIPAAVSNSAGTFVCNHLFFGLMHRLSTRPLATGVRGGFIHIPYLPEQAARFPGAPSMALDTVIAALRIAVATALTVRQDVRETGGQLS
ncbi:Pyrrolidone-carboxylate peptidase [Variovorax sp. PBS-H4]|uniref:pyroglutamyl-peptidase I n=1 Tax=Variovorax sp. PBS-H4 TaxID=434008 RepID=UPI001315C231|nr:pyroglutamyl-peptidase I [Variovorax sp. PBS-H4]VTU40384.1 Pyrrolidone-carboxylate peptidase [Variovorax sp. PBS-H4]